MSWKISIFGSKGVIQDALLAHEDAFDWNPEVVISGSEIAEDRPEEWVLEAWYAHKPSLADHKALKCLFVAGAPELIIEKVPERDWVTLSQQGVEPIRAGRFYVHTPDFPASNERGMRDFVIPASRAFGTGQHETTAGCLAMLTEMKDRGVVLRNVADIGTGTGLLAFAALELWPRALATASDIDPVCVPVVAENAALNDIPMGAGQGQLVMMAAAGMDHPLLTARGPYDLLIANILAGPLVELAPDFSRAVLPGGHILLAGLLETQEQIVRTAYRKAGLRLAARLVNGDWSILWLRKRAFPGARPLHRGKLPEWAERW